jgi:hypothetical protein
MTRNRFRGCTTLVAAAASALALVGLVPATAAAQNPFHIDGIITDTNNSGVAPGALKMPDPGSVSQAAFLSGLRKGKFVHRADPLRSWLPLCPSRPLW